MLFVLNSLLLGVGLAMDAFSVSLANGMADPKMKKTSMWALAGTFAFFQAFMPMTGWFLVKTAADTFERLQKYIPYIALFLLAAIGLKMIVDGVFGGEEAKVGKISFGYLLMQGIATSIDALSVGFTICGYSVQLALMCSLLIAAVTLVICLGGVVIGKQFGNRLAGASSIFGGLILIGIGLEIFLSR